MERERFIQLADIKLAYLDFGGPGPVALLLHGLAGYAGEWLSTATWLTKTHRVYALDQRGHGSSEKMTDYSRSAYVDDTIGFIERLHLSPVVLIGQSMGGLNAFLVAARRPDLVRALVVAEATPARSESAQGDVDNWFRSWPVPFPNCAAAQSFFGRNELYARTWAEGLEKREDGYWPRFRVADMVASMADITEREYWEEWCSIQCATLIVSGERSGMSTSTSTEMAQRLQHSRHVSIKDAGHDVHLDQPKSWEKVVTTFLKSMT